MAVSCSCDSDGKIYSVGNPRFVTCRTPRKSTCCGKDLKAGDGMYIVSFYDFLFMVPESPGYICEPCGDMALNLKDLGYCFTYCQDIVKQWRDYLNKEKEINRRNYA